MYLVSQLSAASRQAETLLQSSRNAETATQQGSPAETVVADNLQGPCSGPVAMCRAAYLHCKRLGVACGLLYHAVLQYRLFQLPACEILRELQRRLAASMDTRPEDAHRKK